MRSRRRLNRLMIPMVASVLVLGAVPAASAAVPASAPDRPTVARAAKDVAVTLITGDRVVLAGGDASRAAVVPGPGRRQLRFSVQRVGAQLYVVPSDVAGLLVAGRLDRRLFDVRGLIAAGYDDARTTSTGLIVTYEHGVTGRTSPRIAGADVRRELPAVNGAAVRVAKGTRFTDAVSVGGQRLAGGIRKIWLDGKRHTLLDQSVPQIGAPVAWQAGYTGKGVTVAVLDSGIDTTHPDLAGQVVEAKNFTDQPAGDDVGHGTHVASTIAGTALASASRYKGVAPDAKLLDGKVCSGIDCSESALIAGLQWAAADKHAKVINFSIGAIDTPGIDPLEEAVNTLTAQTGSLFVVAAGNDGPDRGTINSPGSADAALTVGAVDKSDELAEFSSRGPRSGDGAIKPDITAPGVGIVAARAKDAKVGEPVGNRYLRLGGTSMATPHVAGVAALLAQQHPDWSATQLKDALMASAKPHATQTAFEQGAGRVDVPRAITQSVYAEQGSLSFGTTRWPHDDDTPVGELLTYRNVGTVPITLQLQATLTGPDGSPAPSGAVSLSATSVTVPAGGTAAVTVLSSTRHDGPDGAYTGRVTATGPGGTRVTTPIAVDKEFESYDLTIRWLGPDGEPSAEGLGTLLSWDRVDIDFIGDPSGGLTVRRPKGRYYLAGWVDHKRDDGHLNTHYLIQPLVSLDKDTTVVVDARLAKPVTVTVERAGVIPDFVEVGLDARLGEDSISTAMVGQSFDGLFSAPLGDQLPPEQATAHVSSHWAVPGARGDFTNSPYLYGVVNTKQGDLYAGFARAVRDKDLAKVTSTVNAQVADRQAVRLVVGFGPGMRRATLVYDLPARVTMYLEGARTDWGGFLDEFVPGSDGFPIYLTQLYTQGGRYTAGRSYSERWNAAVFGPSMASADAARDGDFLGVNVPMYSDQDRHGGGSRVDTASTKLFRDGALVGESAFDAYVQAGGLPAEPGDFRLVSAATRPSVSGLSTRTEAVWTFRSQAASRSEPLPLWGVRYLPAVDSHNAVRRRPVTILPVRLDTVPGASAGSLRTVEVKVSGDDGRTWTRAAVRRTGTGTYVAVFRTPSGSHVSLRTKAADSAGNTTEQAIIRAYALR